MSEDKYGTGTDERLCRNSIFGLKRTELNHYLRIASVLFVVMLAFFCRRIVLTTGNGFIEQLANYVRIFLYLGLFSLWGISVQGRVVQPQLRRLLVLISLLMIFWLTLREFRWHFVTGQDLSRLLWYAYYIPILLIPLITFFVSLCSGKGEAYRLPKWTAVLTAVTILLILTVLSNDLHHGVFVFSAGSMETELDYAYGPLYYVVTAWGICCIFAAFVVMLKKCSLPGAGRIFWLPLVPFAAAVIYVVLYAARSPFMTSVLGDFAVLSCLLITAFFESCISCGLIPSNRRYFELFEASQGIGAQITDNGYNVRYSSRDSASFSPELLRQTENGPVILEDGRRLNNMPVNGGHAVWSEDISELLNKQEELQSVQEELTDRNEIVRMEYEQEKARRVIEEQNRLYDLMEQKTRSQLAGIRRLAADYAAAEDADAKRNILARIIVAGCYIKRRRDIVLAEEGGSPVTSETLANALEESFSALKRLGIRGAFYIEKCNAFPAKVPATAYDLFENILESSWDTAHYIDFRLSSPEGALRCSVETDGNPDRERLASAFPSLAVSDNDDGVRYMLSFGGGDGI